MLLSAAAGWFLLPQEQIGQTLVMPRRDAWSVPPLPRRAVENATVALAATAPYWGAQGQAEKAASSAPQPEDPRWRIAAVFGSASRRGVLVSFSAEGKAPQRLFVGDALPSGHRITRIDERELCVRLGNKNYRLGVERREP
jgi:hypothetical protein